MPEPWELPVSTAIGPVRLSQVANHRIGKQHVYAMVVELGDLAVGRPDRPEPGKSVLIGFFSVDDPKAVDEDTRRQDDPVDLRVNTIWLHPTVRCRGVGTAMETVAKKFGLFESHSQTRTEAGSRLAAAVGDQLSPAADVPDNGEIDEGGHLTYRLILRARPDLTGLLDA